MQILFFEDVRIMRLCVCLYTYANTAGSFGGLDVPLSCSSWLSA